MHLIKDFLVDKKIQVTINDLNVEVSEFLESQHVENGSLIQALIFNEDSFTEEEAKEWALAHHFYVDGVIETEDSFRIMQFDPSEFESSSLVTIEVSTGIKAVVGIIRIEECEPDFSSYNLSLRNNGSIKFSDATPHIIELAKVIKGHHVSYGPVEITKDMLKSFVRNFREGVVGVDLMVDYKHEQAEAAGWIKDVYLSPDETMLYGEVRWTTGGATVLSDRTFRYFSPEFNLSYVHPHTGKNHGATLIGGALVNRPFLKMDAIVAFDEGNNNNKEGIKMETILMSEHNAKIAEIKLSEDKALNVIKGQKDEIVKLSEELDGIKKEKAEGERLATNEKLFSENKINKAQLDALNEGKNIIEVLSLSENMNVAPQGKVIPENNGIQLSEADAAACKSMGISPEDYVKYNS